IQKTITPTTGPVGRIHVVVVTIQNLDNVTVNNLTASDPEASPPYLQTLQISPSGTQTAQALIFPPGTRQTMSYTVTTDSRSEEHTSELQSRFDLVCRLL